MTFIGKETFREGNIWLEGGAEAGTFRPFMFGYRDYGDGTFTRMVVPPITVSTEYTSWFGFTYREDLPDDLTSGTPDQFSMTAADAISRGGTFIQYDDDDPVLSLTDDFAPNDPIGVKTGTSAEYPAGTSATWKVLDAQMVVIGERTIEFAAEGGGSGNTLPWYSGNYVGDPSTQEMSLTEGPVAIEFNVESWRALISKSPVPASATDSNEIQALGVTVQDCLDAGVPWLDFDGTVMDVSPYPPNIALGGGFGNVDHEGLVTIRFAADEAFTDVRFTHTAELVNTDGGGGGGPDAAGVYNGVYATTDGGTTFTLTDERPVPGGYYGNAPLFVMSMRPLPASLDTNDPDIEAKWPVMTVGEVKALGGVSITVGDSSNHFTLDPSGDGDAEPIMQVSLGGCGQSASLGIYRSEDESDPISVASIAFEPPLGVSGPREDRWSDPNSIYAIELRFCTNVGTSDLVVAVTPAEAVLRAGDINLYETWVGPTAGTLTVPHAMLVEKAGQDQSMWMQVHGTLNSPAGPAGTYTVTYGSDVQTHEFTWPTP